MHHHKKNNVLIINDLLITIIPHLTKIETILLQFTAAALNVAAVSVDTTEREKVFHVHFKIQT